MTATSGIGLSTELTRAFSAAVETRNIRFIKVVIQNESLVSVASIDVVGSLEEDLASLDSYLSDKDPCYVLTRLDDPSSEWLLISYVPDGAKVRDKMLYASTRNSLTKSLGSTVFTDSLFATSKADVTPEAYAAHKRHQAAPQPMSAREQEMADIRAAEREAAGNVYEGSRARQNHLGDGKLGYKWSSEAEDAVKQLGHGEGSQVVILQIELSTETIVLHSNSEAQANTLSSLIPPSEPSFTLFAWSHSYSTTRRDIIFIYSCPSASPIKYRMVYSSGALLIFKEAKAFLETTPSFLLAPKKLETSDPSELTEQYLMQELSFGNSTADNTHHSATQGSTFARPRGPARRR
ncbi:hypothetical protein EV401DRAFT_807599 [Pisolithus croceorrhizus]|nr:hypothetical protein EV401DRAFT_807599 [Pisolithus croceorrhizus]